MRQIGYELTSSKPAPQLTDLMKGCGGIVQKRVGQQGISIAALGQDTHADTDLGVSFSRLQANFTLIHASRHTEQHQVEKIDDDQASLLFTQVDVPEIRAFNRKGQVDIGHHTT